MKSRGILRHHNSKKCHLTRCSTKQNGGYYAQTAETVAHRQAGHYARGALFVERASVNKHKVVISCHVSCAVMYVCGEAKQAHDIADKSVPSKTFSLSNG